MKKKSFFHSIAFDFDIGELQPSPAKITWRGLPGCEFRAASLD